MQKTLKINMPATGPVLYLLYALIGAGEMTRILVPFLHNPIDALWSDPGRWWSYATTGLQTAPLAMIDPVFYQAWLSFVARFTLESPILTAAYSGLLSAVTPWLWYRFLREMLDSRIWALIGWAILAWLPSWIGIYSYFMTETLLLPLMGLSLWLSWRSMRKRDTASLVLAALVWMLAGLTRGIAAPLALVVMVFVWMRQEKKIPGLAYSSLMIVLVLTSLGYRSYAVTGAVAPLGEPWMNEAYVKSGNREIKINYVSDRNIGYLYGFQSPSIGLEIFAPFSRWQSSRSETVTATIELDDLANSWNKTLHEIEQDMPSRAWLTGENIIFLMFGPSWPDTNPARLFEQLGTWMRFLWAPLFLVSVALLGRQLMRKRGRAAGMLFALLLTWFVLQGLMLFVVNEGRYRKPVEGLIVAALLLAGERRFFSTPERGH